MNRYLNQFKISHRLWLMAVVSILCVISVSTLYIFEIHDHVYEEKQTKTRHLVEAVYGVLEYFNAQEQAGKLNRKEAQAAAIEIVKQLRYESQEYFWINDMRPNMVMHPYKPQLDGKDLSNVKDPAGKRLFVEFVTKVRQEGAGYVNYLWPKPGEVDPVSKISYVKGFTPWGWIIGSGIYLDDVEATFAEHWQGNLLNLLVVLSLLALITTTLTKSITAPIQRVGAVLKGLAKGEADLSEELDMQGNSEISEMSRNLHSFVDKLRGLVNQLMNTSESLLMSTNQVTSIAHGTNQSVIQQRAESDQVAAAMTELNVTAGNVVDNAAQAASAAEQANTMALESKQIIAKSESSIATLNDNIKATTEVIRQLQNGSEQIGGIVETIQSISEQTNLLALNAAIEAARAGDQGRGFAVVADEVRELAKRTQESTLEIEKMIGQLQQGAEQAVKVVEGGRIEAELSVEHAQQTGHVLADIVDAISNIKEMNTQIATAAEQQSAVVGEINQNVVRISTIANDNAAGASSTVNVAESIGAQLNRLMEVAAGFRLSQQDASFDFSAARSAHLAWVGRVEAHLDRRTTIREDELLSHHNCALGHWYDGPGLANNGHIEAMQRIEAPHEQLHRTIKECVMLEKQGEHAAAREKLNRLNGLSRQIVELLHKVEQDISLT